MNIYGYKLKLEKARNMLENLNIELRELLRKRKKRDWEWDEIGRLNLKIKKVRGGMSDLKDKIKILRQNKKQK